MITRQQLRTPYFILYAMIVFVLYFCYRLNSQPFRLKVAKVSWIKYAAKSTISQKNDFRYNWLRMHLARTDWRAILKPFSNQMAWGTLKSGWDKANRSSARTSYISYMAFQPSGQFSRIFIETRTASGQKKTIGGDFWRVFFTGPANVSATVFDHQNGTYEAIALLMETGNYTVRAYLDYSLCDGLRDPPEDWFQVGKCCCCVVLYMASLSYGVVWYCMVWYVIIWYVIAWYDMVLHVMICYDYVLWYTLWCGEIWYSMVRCVVVWYGVVWMVWCI